MQVRVADERPPETRRTQPEQEKANEWAVAVARKQNENCPERANESGDLSGVGVLHSVGTLRVCW